MANFTDEQKHELANMIGEQFQSLKTDVSNMVTGAVTRISKKQETVTPQDNLDNLDLDSIKDGNANGKVVKLLLEERKQFKEEQARKARESHIAGAMEEVGLDPSNLKYVMVDIGDKLSAVEGSNELLIDARPLGEYLKEYAEGKGKRFRPAPQAGGLGLGPVNRQQPSATTSKSKFAGLADQALSIS